MTRKLGLFSVTALGVNTIVGSGIHRLPAELARDLGPASLLAYPACALLLGTVALAFAEASGMFAGDGGPYRYACEAFGPRTGFAVGWSMWVATVLTLASVAAATPGQLAELVPAAGGRVGAAIVAAGVVVLLGAANRFGRRPGAWASNVLLVAKLAPLVLLVVVGALHVRPAALSPFAPRGWAPMGAAMLPAFFALSGFETASIPAGEAERATRDVPLAVVMSLFGAALAYAAIQLVAVALVPELGQSERPLVDAARVLGGDVAAKAMAAAGVLAMAGLCAAMAFVGPRLLAALADDGHLPAALARRDAAYDAPVVSVVATTVAAAVLAVVLDFRSLVDFTSVTVVVQYFATCVAVVQLRRSRPLARRSVRLPLGPVIPLVGALLLVGVLTQARLVELALAAAALAAGAIARFAHRRVGVAS